MKVNYEIKIEGLKEAFDALKEFSRTTKNRIIRKAITKAMQPLTKMARQRAPRESGLLRKSIGYVVVTNKKKGSVTGYMGPRKEFSKVVTFRRSDTGKTRTMKRDPRFYKHLVEKGTKRGQAKPFLKPTWDDGQATAKQIIISTITTEIAAYRIKKAAKK